MTGRVRRWFAGRSGRFLAWVVVALLVGALAGVAIWVVLTNISPKEAGQVRLAQTVLAIIAGAGGLLGLIVTARRQWTTELDNRERRITEEYTQAADQLGSEKAPVRLAGLYALERLAQNNPEHRQTIVNVLCAYLRMPYTPPDPSSSPRRLGVRRPLNRSHRRITHPAIPSVPTVSSDSVADIAVQEREVRLTAQRILASHLRTGSRSQHWADIDIDLTAATLIDLDLGNCQMRTATFIRTKFSGDARFDGARFSGESVFAGAKFGGDAWFDKAQFSGDARFDATRFGNDAWFAEASFGGDVRFREASFSGDAMFVVAQFSGRAWFGEAQFSGGIGGAAFDEAQFASDAWFDRAQFSGRARFDRAQFGRRRV